MSTEYNPKVNPVLGAYGQAPSLNTLGRSEYLPAAGTLDGVVHKSLLRKDLVREELIDKMGRAKFENIVNNPKLSAVQKRLLLRKMASGLTVELETRVETAKEKARSAEEIAEHSKRSIAVFEWYEKWLGQELKFEKNDCTRFHSHRDAMSAGDVVDPTTDDGGYVLRDGFEPHVFVVDARWSNLVKDSGDEVRLPYRLCVFEFMISGAPILVYACEKSDTETVYFAYLQTPHGWLFLTTEISDMVQELLLLEVRAICIALDAEVLTRTIIRAPAALNRKREKNGRSAVRDYHLLNLVKKYRAANPSDGQSGGHKRLHFRRGHWRHYGESKTWIRWCLAGDPALGFYDKDYKL